MSYDIITAKSTSMSITSLTKYMPPQAQAFNLLQDKVKTIKVKRNQRPVTHWKPKIVANIVSKPLSLSRSSLPAEIAHLLKLVLKAESLKFLLYAITF